MLRRNTLQIVREAQRSVLLYKAVVLCAFLTLLAVNAWAASSLRIKAIPQSDLLRLMFFTSGSRLDVALNGQTLTVTLPKAFTADVGSLAAQSGGRIAAVHKDEAGRTLRFDLTPGEYKVRRLLGEGFVGVDLLGRPSSVAVLPKETASAIAELKTALEKKGVPVAKKEAVNTPVKEKPAAPKEAEARAEEPTIKLASVPVPVARPGAKYAAAEKVATPKLRARFVPAAVESKDAQAAARAAVTAPEEAPAPQKTEEAQPEKQAVAAEEEPVRTTPREREAARKISVAEDAGEEEVSAKNIPSSAVRAKLVFPWQSKDVGAAIFRREEALWIVFDKPSQVQVEAIVRAHPTVFSSAKQVENKQYTVLYLPLKADVYPLAYKEENNWVVTTMERNVVPTQPVEISVENSKLHGTGVLLESKGFGAFLRILDPSIGDEIIIVPNRRPETGIGGDYRYTDFVVLNTAQGVAIELAADDVAVQQTKEGLSVAGPTNRIPSDAWLAKKQELERKRQEEAARAKALKDLQELAFFKFRTWAAADVPFSQKEEQLEWEVVNANWDMKSQKRLDLARFYFANGLSEEAVGVIKMIQEGDSAFAETPQVKALEAAAQYRMGRYLEAEKQFDSIDKKILTVEEQREIDFWGTAAKIQIANSIQTDRFLQRHPLKDTQDKQENTEDKNEITKLILETSSRLLKMIKQIDPDMANAEEVQTLESTARFVSSHYQEEIRRFDQPQARTGDTFESEEDTVWWNVSGVRRSGGSKSSLPFMENINDFLFEYPADLYNHFALLSLDEKLRREDLAGAEPIFDNLKDDGNPFTKNSLSFYRGLFFTKDDEPEKAKKEWEPLTKEVMDRYNRARSQFALTNLLLRGREISLDDAIARLNSIRVAWRGDALELNMLRLLGEFYMDKKDYAEGFRAWREVITSFPGSEEALLIARKMNEQFVYLFNAGGADDMPDLDALALYYEFRELTPIGKQGDQMIHKLAERLVKVDLLDRAAALLTHQVRFRLTGEERDETSARLAEIHLMNKQPDLALDVLKATDNPAASSELQQKRRYLKARSLTQTYGFNKALRLLAGDENREAAFLRADIYWRTRVWYKVIDELDWLFKEIARDERTLTDEESEQVIRLALAYALTSDQRRLKTLQEDFASALSSDEKRQILAFVALDRGPVDPKNLKQTVEFDDLKSFLDNYIKFSESKDAPVSSGG